MTKERPLNSVDLFAGCGGLSLGLSQAGFETLAFSEINRDAANTFEKNLGGVSVRRFGPVAELTPAVLGALKRGKSGRPLDVDLVCGGPPCQGYSGIGHRRSYHVQKADIPSNYLFREMVRVVKSLQPKFFLFENVRGLLTGRWTAEGEKGEIWNEVRETFGNIRGYEIGWQLVQASAFGVPQNRPRIILVGMRADLGAPPLAGDSTNTTSNPRGLIPSIRVRAPDLIDVLSDLDDPDFATKDVTPAYLRPPESRFQRELRTSRSGRVLGVGRPVSEQEYSRHAQHVTRRFAAMLANGGEIPRGMRTKKFAQRLLPSRWNGSGPSITATSLPDDFVHYARPRILTVREWARLQTFPDWFEFSGSRTTGGSRRAGIPTEGIWDREVPKYTQIGNAVPVALAKAVGEHIAGLLRC